MNKHLLFRELQDACTYAVQNHEKVYGHRPSPDEDATVNRLYTPEGGILWFVSTGLSDRGLHTTLADAHHAEDWFEGYEADVYVDAVEDQPGVYVGYTDIIGAWQRVDA